MFHTFFYEPIYNLLVLFLTIVPYQEIGVSIILVTFVVKAFLYPLNKKSAITQHSLKKVEEEMKAIKSNHKNDPKKSGELMLDLYKREKINPFSSILAIALQIPIFFALYKVFSKGLHSDPSSLYSFIHFPENISVIAFGFINVTEQYIYIGILTGITYFFLAKSQTKMLAKKKDGKKEETFQEKFNETMRIQMLYVIPLIAGASAAYLPSAVGIYWITSNLLGIVQDIIIKKHIKTPNAEPLLSK